MTEGCTQEGRVEGDEEGRTLGATGGALPRFALSGSALPPVFAFPSHAPVSASNLCGASLFAIMKPSALSRVSDASKHDRHGSSAAPPSRSSLGGINPLDTAMETFKVRHFPLNHPQSACRVGKSASKISPKCVSAASDPLAPPTSHLLGRNIHYYIGLHRELESQNCTAAATRSGDRSYDHHSRWPFCLWKHFFDWFSQRKSHVWLVFNWIDE